MSDKTSTWSVYRRLLRYIKPYGVRVTIGILAGVICGGAAFGLLHTSYRLMQHLEDSDAAIEEPVAAEEAPTISKAEAMAVTIGQKLNITAIDKNGVVTPHFLFLTLMVFVPVVLIRALADYLNRYNLRWVGARVVRDLRADMFDNLQQQSLAFFGKSDVGKLISRGTNDAAVIELVISVSISDIVRAPIEILAALMFVVLTAMQKELLGFVLSALLVFPVVIVPIVILGRFVRRYTHRALERISDVVSRMHENFTCVKVVKAYNMEKSESDRFKKMNHKYFASIIKALRAELMMGPLMECVALIMVSIFFIICLAKQIPLATLFALGLASVMAYKPLKHLARINANLQRGSAALVRIYELLDADTALAMVDNPVELTGFNDKIEFCDVEFQYPGEEEPLISNVDITIPRGSVIAVVGGSGTGKSTLANLLARFYDPTKGHVMIDGQDLKQVDIASLRKLIGVVSQETVLFNDTVANNISYGSPDVVREEIIAAAKQANAHEFIEAAADGYDRVVGEKGIGVSGGERQRIALARAILKNPPILILDEATSALDTVTERLVQEAIAHVMQNRTVFAIAHRLSTVKHADQIILIEDGGIAERGTHEELYEAEGKYRKLCDMQVLDS